MKKNYQVVIIGAGPAGLSTALHLKENGIEDILVIEKGKFPRYKCCAGYITTKTKKVYEKLGLNLEDCHYSLIKDFGIFYKLNKRQTIENKFLYTNKQIDRVELDYEFYKLAKQKGIQIVEGITIKTHDTDKSEICFSDNQKVCYEKLVFADGTLGYGSKYQRCKKKNIALQLTFPSSKLDEIQIHFGITKRGYGWVSSYQGITNVGLTDVYDDKNNYREIFQKFLEQLNIEISLKDLKGAFTPIGVRKPILYSNIYYVGDAVGACDPLTLSGLRYGLKTGEKCALAISKNNPKIYKNYIQSLKCKFIIMQLILKVFYVKSILFLIFNVGCRYFSRLISFAFNHFFVNKK